MSVNTPWAVLTLARGMVTAVLTIMVAYRSYQGELKKELPKPSRVPFDLRITLPL